MDSRESSGNYDPLYCRSWPYVRAHSSDMPSADPYVTVTYSRQGKPLYSTRIIFDDLNPCFEETAVITLDANAIKVREKVNLQVWDSDRTSAVCLF